MKNIIKILFAVVLVFAFAFSLCIGAGAAIEDKWNIYHSYYDGSGLLVEDLDDTGNGFTVKADENGAIVITYPDANVKWWPSAMIVSKEATALDGISLKGTLELTDAGWGGNANISFTDKAPTNLPNGTSQALVSNGIQVPDGTVGFSLLLRGDQQNPAIKRVGIVPFGFELDEAYAKDDTGTVLTDADEFPSSEDVTVSVAKDNNLGYIITINGKPLKASGGQDLNLTGLKNALGDKDVFTTVGVFAPGSATGKIIFKEFNGQPVTDAAAPASSQIASSQPASSQPMISSLVSEVVNGGSMLPWIVLGIILAAAVVGIIAYFVAKNKRR